MCPFPNSLRDAHFPLKTKTVIPPYRKWANGSACTLTGFDDCYLLTYLFIYLLIHAIYRPFSGLWSLLLGLSTLMALTSQRWVYSTSEADLLWFLRYASLSDPT